MHAVAADPVPDRYGRAKTDRIILVADEETGGAHEDGLDPTELAWTLKRREWRVVEDRYGDDAWTMVTDRIRRGLVTLEATTRVVRTGDGPPLAIDTPVRWRPTGAGTELSKRLDRARARSREALAAATLAAAARVEPLDRGFASGLRDPQLARRGETTVTALIAAAHDLADGISHDGPRAFSQTHFAGSNRRDATKVRGNIADLLRGIGADHETVAALGLARHTRFHVGGPVTVRSPDGSVLVSTGLTGLVSVRSEQTLSFEVQGGPTLVVVENLQAAEALLDDPDLETVVVWTGGHPSPAARRHLATLARRTERTLVVCDADLGGVRIANTIHRDLSMLTDLAIVDIGEWWEVVGEPFSDDYGQQLKGLVDTPAGHVARGALRRGYVVEQEAPTRRATTGNVQRLRSRDSN